MRSFASDNNSGVHPLVMEALNRANRDHAVGYGDDVWTEEAVRKIREAFYSGLRTVVCIQWNRQQCCCLTVMHASL